MLKIKDDVDLKELEKFRFKYKEEEHKYYEYKNSFIEIDIFLDLKKRSENKVLFISSNKYNHEYMDVDILYDLIKANLVVWEDNTNN